MSRKGLHHVSAKGTEIAQLYDTVIMYRRGSKMFLNSGGWKTRHTKNCLNDVLPYGFSVYQKNFEWFLNTPEGTIPFKDNMEIDYA